MEEATEVEAEERILAKVTTISGMQIDAMVCQSIKVSQLKEELAARLEVVPTQLVLVLDGNVVEDDFPVADCTADADGCRSFTAVVAMPMEVANGLKLLQDEDAVNRRKAARSLGMIGALATAASEALELVLESDRDEDVRIEAARALGKIGQPVENIVPALLRCGKTCLANDSRLHKAVTEAFITIGRHAVSFLVEALWAESANLVLRASVVRTLGLIGEAASEAIADLERIVALEQNAPDLRKEAAAAVGKMGKEALPTLERFLRHWDKGVCKAAADAVVADSEDPVPVLMRAATDSTSVWRATVTAALGQVGSAARPGLEDLASSRDGIVCSAAASALGQIGDADSIPVLEELLQDSDWDACVAATEALGKMGNHGVASLAQAVKVEYWAVHDVLLRVLEELGQAAVPVLRSMLLEPVLDLQLRVRIVETLGRIGPPADQAVRALITLLEPTSPPVLVGPTVETLRAIGPAAGLSAPALAEVLRRPSTLDNIRGIAAEALIQLGEVSVEPLASCLAAENIVARKLAVSALGRLGEAGVPLLLRMLDHPDAGMRQDVAWALGIIGPAAAPAAPRLAKLLCDVDPWVRFEAAEALGMLGRAAALAAPALVECLGDCSHWSSAAAAHALGKVGVEMDFVVAALLGAQALAARTDNTELETACARAVGRLAFSTKKCAFLYVHRKVVELATRMGCD